MFSTSTVCPDIDVTMSPGLVARPDGMFSQVGITPSTFTLSFSSAAARSAPSTEAAPHMSNFISSISAAGLIEMPPVSNVIPLPTSAIGSVKRPRLAPWYLATIRRGGWSEPFVTDRKAPIRSASICLRSSTCTPIPQSLCNLRACWPR